MAWIESHQTLKGHPKLDRLCELLEIDDVQAIGHLHLLWWWCIDYALDGDLTRYTPGQIAKAAHWKDNAQKFMQALIEAGFVDAHETGRSLHDWTDFCGTLVEKRLERIEKSRAGGRASAASRAKQRENSCMDATIIPQSSRTSPKNVRTGEVREPTQPTVPYQPNPTQPTVPAREISRSGSHVNGAYKRPPDTPENRLLIVVKQLQGYDAKDAEWDGVYLDQYKKDAAALIKFFGGDWKKAAIYADSLVEEFKKKELSWSMRTLVNRAPDWRKRHE